MTDGRTRVLTAVLVLLVIFGLGVVVGAFALGNAGQAPCWEVTADLQGTQDTLAETFGSGEEGRAAIEDAQAAMAARPDCFSPEAREFMENANPTSGPVDEPEA